VEVSRDGATSAGAKAGLAVVRAQLAGASVEGCVDVVGDAHQRLVSPAGWEEVERRKTGRAAG
jgi:Holliday junction resolvase